MWFGMRRVLHQLEDYVTSDGNVADDGAGAAAEVAGRANVAADPLAAILRAKEVRGTPWPVRGTTKTC